MLTTIRHYEKVLPIKVGNITTMKTKFWKLLVVATVMIGFVANQTVSAKECSKVPAPVCKAPAPVCKAPAPVCKAPAPVCKPPVYVCSHPPECGHNYCTPKPPCEDRSKECCSFQNCVNKLVSKCDSGHKGFCRG
jgi:hypothetical protein